MHARPSSSAIRQARRTDGTLHQPEDHVAFQTAVQRDEGLSLHPGYDGRFCAIIPYALPRIPKGSTEVIFQHETDHLHGILFTDRLAEQEQEIYCRINEEADLYLKKGSGGNKFGQKDSLFVILEKSHEAPCAMAGINSWYYNHT